jgi:hypothetical protein
MRRASVVNLCVRPVKWAAAHVHLIVFGLGLSIAPSQPSFAQERKLPMFEDPKGDLCVVFSVGAPPGKPQPEIKQLYAKCPDRTLILGQVTAFEAVVNEGLQATLVDAVLGEERRVLLLAAQKDRPTLVEDLNGQIARAAGRGPMSTIEGIALDLKRFAETGEIGVAGGLDERGRGGSGRVDVKGQVALERSRSSSGAVSH